MASQIIANTPQDDAATLHAYALSAFEEWLNELDKLFAVAAAGRGYCGEDKPVHANLFAVVEDGLADRTLAHMVQDRINGLARLAGVEVQS